MITRSRQTAARMPVPSARSQDAVTIQVSPLAGPVQRASASHNRELDELGPLPMTDDVREAMRRQAVQELQRLRQLWEEIARTSPYAAYTRVPAWERNAYNASVQKLWRASSVGCDVAPNPPVVTTTASGQPHDRVSLRIMLQRVKWVLSTYGAASSDGIP